METKTRIYFVQGKAGPQHAAMAGPDSNKGPQAYLVEARSQQAARDHVANKFVGEAKVPTTKELAEAMGKGAKVEKAGEDGQ